MNQDDLQALRARGQFRASPLERDDVRVQRYGADRASPVTYFVYRDVLDELTFAARYRPEDAFAVLTGAFGVAQGTGFVEVTGFEDLLYPKDDDDVIDTFVETLRRTMNGRRSEVVVGLFASTPRSEAIIQPHVAHLHLTLFNIPFQPLLVVDAESDALTVYGRAPRRTFVDAPLYVVSPEPKSPVLDDV